MSVRELLTKELSEVAPLIESGEVSPVELTRAALDLILGDHFSRNEPGVFGPLGEVLLGSDHYLHLADLRSYMEADQRLVELYADPDGWARKAILNIAGSGKFSSDRTIAEYAAHIWGAEPCPVP